MEFWIFLKILQRNLVTPLEILKNFPSFGYFLVSSSFQYLDKIVSFNLVLLNPSLTNVSILHPLKTPENQRFSGVFRGYKMGRLLRNGLIKALFSVISWAFWALELWQIMIRQFVFLLRAKLQFLLEEWNLW